MVRWVLSTVLFCILPSPRCLAQDPFPTGSPAQTPPGSGMVLTTNVRRVVLDVVVTNTKGEIVRDLHPADFTVREDGSPQAILSFEGNGFGESPDYTPPKLPPVPQNTFFDVPTTPETGPLYVLLYDLVNMDNDDQMSGSAEQHPDQMRAREQLLRFIQSKPEGARFAIYAFSDGLHLVQGFTSDKEKLFEAIDPHKAHPHMPKIFLMGRNFGRGDPHTSIAVLNELANTLDGLPGRKNLIWFSGEFPLAFTPAANDGPTYMEEIKATLNMLARNQIAIYPVDCRGVVAQNWHGQNGMQVDAHERREDEASEGGPDAAPDAPGTQAAAAKTSGAGAGANLLLSSYSTMDEIARVTGGRAFYSNNDVAGELMAATHTGEAYYTLTYSPTNHAYNGKERNIRVTLNRPGATLEYRRSYYATDTSNASKTLVRFDDLAVAKTDGKPSRATSDALSVSMRHGAPLMHGLIFAVQVKAAGEAGKPGSEELAQMAHLATLQKRSAPRSAALQHYDLRYSIFTRQFGTTSTPLHLEIAAAAFDSEGRMLNAFVNDATRSVSGDSHTASAPLFQAQQGIGVPLEAKFLRFAIHDTAGDRVGAVEIKLPLDPDTTQP